MKATAWMGIVAALAAVASCDGSAGPGSDPCADHRCGEGARCVVEGGEATCVCLPGYVDDGSGCVLAPSCEGGCPVGEHCAEGSCVPNRCEPPCAAGETCLEHGSTECRCGEGPACAEGTSCVDGSCAADPCDPPCPEGETCADDGSGVCLCGDGPGCAEGERCLDGRCVGSCDDGEDDDGDGWIDGDDPDCPESAESGLGATECNDGEDNDGDELVDSRDPDCETALDEESGEPPEHVPGSLAACLLDPSCHRVAVTSHMGAWTPSIPGNSMAAYRRAFDLGADAIEADVRVSRDGVPFMIHNDEITYYESLMCAGRVVSESDASEIDDCLLLPSLTETIPTFDEFVEWARGRVLIHLDVKSSEDLGTMVAAILDHGAEDFAFIAVSGGEARTVLPTISDEDLVYFVLRVDSVAAIDEALGALARPNIFMLEGDRSWDAPPVDETAMVAEIARVHAAGLRIMASSDTISATVPNHRELFDMGFDVVLSYNTANGVEAAAAVNAERGYGP